jgi:hypothetical protein
MEEQIKEEVEMEEQKPKTELVDEKRAFDKCEGCGKTTTIKEDVCDNCGSVNFKRFEEKTGNKIEVEVKEEVKKGSDQDSEDVETEEADESETTSEEVEVSEETEEDLEDEGEDAEVEGSQEEQEEE